MLWKCCTQYASKFGKQQGPQDWKRSFFHSNPEVRQQKMVQITIQLHSFHMLERLCSKFFKLCFSSMWLDNFQMYQRNQRSNCQHQLEKQSNSNIYIYLSIYLPTHIHFCFIDYAITFEYVDHNKLWNILEEMGISDHLTCLLRNLYAGQEATFRTGHGTSDWFQIWKGICQG